MADRPHFRLFGIPVRVDPVFLLIAGMLGYQLIDESVSLVFVWIGVTFVSILVHELGHALLLKAYGEPSSIVLHGMGGVTVSQNRLPKARSIAVSLAGSCVSLLLLWMPARVLNSSEWIHHQTLWVRGAVAFTAFANLWWSVANLLPIRPLDGGNVVTELVGAAMARRVSMVAAIVGGIWALKIGQQFAGILALFLAFSSYQEITAERAARS
jgi:stage IV sporulation protein FB